MSASALVPLPGNEAMAAELVGALGGELLVPEMRSFPDGETYLRLDRDLHGRSVALVCTFDRPDAKILPLLFAAGTMRDLGATRVGLVAPYLAYMRQDHRFHPGEALTSKMFASLLSTQVDWLVTIDPHLHRIHSLGEIFSVPTRVLHAAPALARWIANEVKDPVLIGPDVESAQWIVDVAKEARAGFVVLEKIRRGDRNVDISTLNLEDWRTYTPVLIDDIISTGSTMIKTLSLLRDAGMKPAVCMAVHAIFAAGAYEKLLAERPARIVTTNTVRHETNAIDMSQVLASGIREAVALCA